MSWGEFWKELEAKANASKGAMKALENQINDMPGWKFGGFDGLVWKARHRIHGERKSIEADLLLAMVRELSAEELVKSQEKSISNVRKRRKPLVAR